MREMTAAYAAARELNGRMHKCTPPIGLGAVMQKRDSVTQSSFPLPGSRPLGKDVGLGLPWPPNSPTCHSMQYDSELKGYWLELRAFDKSKEEVTSFVLISENGEGASAIKLKLTRSQREMFNSYRNAKNQPDSRVMIENVISLGEQISNLGFSQMSFALPGGRFLGKQGIMLGLPWPCNSPTCHSMQYDSELKGYWLELRAFDKSNKEVTSFVLISENCEGPSAIQLKLTRSQRDMFDGYRNAKNQPDSTVKFENEIYLGEQIRTSGQTQNCFALPGGRSLGKDGLGLGLPQPCSPTCHSMHYDSDLKGYWLELRAKNKVGVEVTSYVLVDESAEGREAIKLTLSPVQKILFDGYHLARLAPSTVNYTCEIRALVGAQNQIKIGWLKPDGDTLLQLKSSSLNKTRPLSSFTTTQFHHLGDDKFVIWATAKYEDGGTQRVRLLSSKDGLEVISSTETNSAQILKGFALDRYAAHLAALARLPDAVANPRFTGSALTGENYIPNMRALDTILHAKWGGQPERVFNDFVLPYGRMLLWHGLPVGCFLLADDTHHEALVTATIKASEKLKFRMGINTLAHWANTVSAESPNVVAELNKLQVLADLGMEDALKAQSYTPTLESHSQGPEAESTDWRTRIHSLATQDRYEELLATLHKHAEVNFPYWEESYHIELAKCCSYLLGNMQELTPAQQQQTRSAVDALYPELKDYPDAWRVLDSDAARTMPQNQTLELVSFDLRTTLEALKAPRSTATQTPDDNPAPGTGRVIEIPELRDFMNRKSSINGNNISLYLAEAVKLKTTHPDATIDIADSCLYAICHVLAGDEKFWGRSPKLTHFKSGSILTLADIPTLKRELESFKTVCTMLKAVEELLES